MLTLGKKKTKPKNQWVGICMIWSDYCSDFSKLAIIPGCRCQHCEIWWWEASISVFLLSESRKARCRLQVPLMIFGFALYLLLKMRRENEKEVKRKLWESPWFGCEHAATWCQEQAWWSQNSCLALVAKWVSSALVTGSCPPTSSLPTLSTVSRSQEGLQSTASPPIGKPGCFKDCWQ